MTLFLSLSAFIFGALVSLPVFAGMVMNRGLDDEYSSRSLPHKTTESLRSGKDAA